MNRVTYEILVDIDQADRRDDWVWVYSFRTAKGPEHAHRVALRWLRASQPITVHGTAAPYRLVIVPEGRAGDTREWHV